MTQEKVSEGMHIGIALLLLLEPSHQVKKHAPASWMIRFKLSVIPTAPTGILGKGQGQPHQ
jgi:hypothetical protein